MPLKNAFRHARVRLPRKAVFRFKIAIFAETAAEAADFLFLLWVTYDVLSNAYDSNIGKPALQQTILAIRVKNYGEAFSSFTTWFWRKNISQTGCITPSTAPFTKQK